MKNCVPVWIPLLILAVLAITLLTPPRQCTDVQRFEDGSIVDHCAGQSYDPDTGTWKPKQ